MKRRYNAWKRATAWATLAIFVIGCTSKDVQREASKPSGLSEARAHQAEPSARLGGDEVDDLAGRIIVGILTAVGEPARDAQGNSIILIPELVNRSSAANEGVAALGARLREDLARTGAASHMAFVDAATLGSASRAHYVLEGEAYTVAKNGQRFWEVFFTLYDVDRQSGAKHDKRWENARGYLVPR